MTSISPLALVFGAVACIVCALAIGVLAYGRRQTAFQTLNEHLERTMERQAVSVPAGDAYMSEALLSGHRQAKPSSAFWAHWRGLLRLQAWGVSRRSAIFLGAGAVFVGILGGVRAGWFLGLLMLSVYGLLVIFFLWRRVEKLRQRMLEQLPGFLDNMVRLITIGNSPQAAFQMAVGSVPAPLSAALQQASAVVAASSNLAYAMEQLERTWRLPEFGLLAAVFRMSTQYGGRTDQVLDRVSAYIRDRLSAERELHAMSAEVRMSAWILSLLPIVVGTLIMVLNDGYFLRMWNDASGRQMIVLAACLELAGVALLYRLAKLR
jgi:tight adherence protein B